MESIEQRAFDYAKKECCTNCRNDYGCIGASSTSYCGKVSLYMDTYKHIANELQSNEVKTMEEKQEISVATAESFVRLNKRIEKLKNEKFQFAHDRRFICFVLDYGPEQATVKLHISDETKKMILRDLDSEIERLEKEIKDFEWFPKEEPPF